MFKLYLEPTRPELEELRMKYYTDLREIKYCDFVLKCGTEIFQTHRAVLVVSKKS